MPSFNSLYTVRSGLFAQRRALEIVGQNVANASTAGYTRQEVSFSAAEPAQVIHSAGRGVNDVNVVRYRDEFLDRQYRSRNGALGYHSTLHAKLSEVEGILGDLTGGGLGEALDEFFNAWDTLALRPNEAVGRNQVVATAEEFLGQVKSIFGQLVEQRTAVNDLIGNRVQDLNAAAQQLADLNHAILNGEVSKQAVGELEDRRDMLLDSMAKLGGVTVGKHSDGTVSVHLAGLPLVDKQYAFPVDMTSILEADMDPSVAVDSTQQFTWSLTWNNTDNAVKFPVGELGALLELRDKSIPEYMKALDNLVRSVATEVNTRHTTGVIPPDVPVDIFTVGTEWMDVQLNAAVKGDPTLIAAGMGTPPAPSDGTRAKSIADIRSASILTGAPVGSMSVTPDNYLNAVTTSLGIAVQQASRRSDGATLQVEQADKQRSAVSGVSLDEEMTKMIQYQQAYNAAARIMTTIDEMLDVVVNRVGLVGR